MRGDCNITVHQNRMIDMKQPTCVGIAIWLSTATFQTLVHSPPAWGLQIAYVVVHNCVDDTTHIRVDCNNNIYAAICAADT